MKIMFAIDRINGFGGAQRVIVNLANQAFLDGNEVSILLTGDNGDSVYELTDGVRVLYPGASAKKMSKMSMLRKIIVNEKPDVIVSFLTMVNVLILTLSLGTGIPVIISERNDPDYCSDKEKSLAKFSYRLAKAIVVQTDSIKRKIEKFYTKTIYVIPNPVVVGEKRKKTYEITHSIVAVGRLNPQKNYYLMLDAMKMFRKTHGDYILHIYGDGDIKNNLIEYSKKLGIGNNVVFHGNDPDVKSKIINADFFIMSSDFEGMPNSLAEAMALGLPVISTNCDGGGAADLIEDNVNGRLVDKGNAEMLSRAMCEYAENPYKAQMLGEKAKEIQNRLSISAVNDLWYGAIRDVLQVQ